jgi:hypothetical protein
MPTIINGTTGIDRVQAGVIIAEDIAANAVTTVKILDANITPAKLSGAQSGSAPIYGCRAWCAFNGVTAGTNAPIAGGNVSTVTRNTTGSYTVNLATAMVDTNYIIVVTGGDAVGSSSANGIIVKANPLTSSTFNIHVRNGANVDNDYARINVAVFG